MSKHFAKEDLPMNNSDKEAPVFSAAILRFTTRKIIWSSSLLLAKSSYSLGNFLK